MHRLVIALLGTPRITLDDKPVETDRRKAIGLLAYLAAEARAHSRESLAALLWPEYPRASAFSYLRRTLWELNQILGKGWIESDRDSVTLARNPGLRVDIEDFQYCVAAGIDQVNTLSEAVSLYRGDFLEGLVIADTLPFEEWQLQQAEYYRGEFAHTLEKLVATLEQNADYEHALLHAQGWLRLDRLNEGAYRAIMRQMARMGDRSGAIKVYQTCIQTLKDELGISPQAETEELYQSILIGEQVKGRSGGQSKTSNSTTPKQAGYLPSPATPFIGRREEIEQILKLVLDPNTHLLSLIGPGGNGKSRLSIQVAGEMVSSFKDGAWFIPLAAVQSLQGLITAIAKVLTFSFHQREASPRQQLLDYLRAKQLLLILDNFEHLIEDGTPLVAEILDSAPGVKILVTSRQHLNLQTEHAYHVKGMRIPDIQTATNWGDPTEQVKSYSAIQFLRERARRVRPDFDVTRENLQSVTQICRLVDGSPLGIELAVDWLELLTPEEILMEISHSLDFLESQAADIPERQRSLRAVFDTSWRLLNEGEQETFKRLCIFKGSFTKQAAMEVGGSSMRTLLRLANKSWLQQGNNGRYQLHEVLRQYGLERLQANPNEWRETKDRLTKYFSTDLQVQGQALSSAGQIQALEAVKSELDSNIPDAWEWLVETGQIDVLIEKMLTGIFHYWLIRRGEEDFISMVKHARTHVAETNERKHILQQAILETVETYFEMSGVVIDDQSKERLKKLWTKVKESSLEEDMGIWYLVLVGTYGSVINYQEGFQRLIHTIPKIQDRVQAWDLGIFYLLAGQFSESNQHETRNKYLSDALSIFQKIGVVHEQGITLHALGEQAAMEGDYKLAIDYCEKAKQLLELVGDIWGVDLVWNNLGHYYIYFGKIDQAFRVFTELRLFSEKTGNRRMLGSNLSWESLAVSRYGDLADAMDTRKRSLEIAIEVDNKNDIAWHTWEMGEIFRLMGDLDQAKIYYRKALPLFEELQDQIGIGYYHRGNGDLAMMRGEWEEAKIQFQEALVYHDKEQRIDRTWGLIYYHSRLGIAFVHMGAFGEAKQHIKTSLALANQWPYQDVQSLALNSLASLLSASGFPTEAIEVAACVANQTTTWNETKKEAREILEVAKQALHPDKAKLSQERGEKCELELLIKQYMDSPRLDE